MDSVRDELLLTDDHEETDDEETDETDDVSSGWLHIHGAEYWIFPGGAGSLHDSDAEG